MGTGIGQLIRQIKIRIDLAGFSVRKKLLGFDQANIFLHRVGKRSLIPILRRNGAVIGDNCDIESLLTFHNCKNYGNLLIGNNVHIGKGCFFDLRDRIVIEDNVVVSMQTTFITHVDLSKSVLAEKYPPAQKCILIKNNCYIGARATILMGVTMNPCSMAAAGAVIISDVQPRTVVGGVPAKKIKQIE
jgi:acetyltransferase-like isoleucine patch superfamily enzyme